jgi:hypothetical protein
MGTSHRHTPSVASEPNWGNSSKAVTNIAGNEKKSDELAENPPAGLSPTQIAKKQQQLNRRIGKNYHRAVRNLVRAAGGRDKVSSGVSKAIGHAGVALMKGFVYALKDIASNGLTAWLKRQNVSLSGKSCRDILDIIRSYIDIGITGLDNTAANEALECVLDEIGQKIGDDVNAFDKIMGAIMDSDEIKNLLDLFFGMYIFSHLSQDFYEKLEYEKGVKVANETMGEIKELIMDDIRRNYGGRDASTVDWSSADGQAFIQKEFDRILYILSGNED